MVRFPALIGSPLVGLVDVIRLFLEEVGRILILLGRSFMWLIRPPLRIHEFVRQLDFVGTQSVFLIVLTGAFTGMVSALQGYNGMHRYGAEGMVGATVALALARELGPVISALMLVGRVGSAMTAELGSMRNTQQIDALSSMAVEPVQYLVVPRIFAATVSAPLLALIFSFAGMVRAYLLSIKYLAWIRGTFMSGVQYYPGLGRHHRGLDQVGGIRADNIPCMLLQGVYATGGARGVGIATTTAVVVSFVLVLISDYFMTVLMFRST